MKTAAALAACLGISFAAAAVGAIASVDAASFYAQLAKPAWAPPASVFGPVWTILYALMGIAAWRVSRTGGFAAHRAVLALFVAQLAVNALWSWLFFAWRLGGWAFVDIVLLWGLVAATLVGFSRVHWLAGALLLPYLLWLTFAAALNYSIWRVNPHVL